jgi:hypothetical protein
MRALACTSATCAGARQARTHGVGPSRVLWNAGYGEHGLDNAGGLQRESEEPSAIKKFVSGVRTLQDMFLVYVGHVKRLF